MANAGRVAGRGASIGRTSRTVLRPTAAQQPHARSDVGSAVTAFGCWVSSAAHATPSTATYVSLPWLTSSHGWVPHGRDQLLCVPGRATGRELSCADPGSRSRNCSQHVIPDSRTVSLRSTRLPGTQVEGTAHTTRNSLFGWWLESRQPLHLRHPGARNARPRISGTRPGPIQARSCDAWTGPRLSLLRNDLLRRRGDDGGDYAHPFSQRSAFARND